MLIHCPSPLTHDGTAFTDFSECFLWKSHNTQCLCVICSNDEQNTQYTYINFLKVGRYDIVQSEVTEICQAEVFVSGK